MYVSIPEVMVVSLSCIKYCWPLFYGFFFVFCGCTERKISPDPTSWKTNNEELIHRLQKDSQAKHLIIRNLVTKVGILERKVVELESERSRTEKIIERQTKAYSFLVVCLLGRQISTTLKNQCYMMSESLTLSIQ